MGVPLLVVLVGVDASRQVLPVELEVVLRVEDALLRKGKIRLFFVIFLRLV